MATIAERIIQGMELRNMRQVDIIEKTGINKGALSSYISGRYEPKQTNIFLLAKALDVSEAWLMGAEVPMERTVSSKEEVSPPLPPLKNISPITKQKFPLFDGIAAGQPRYIPDGVELYIEASTKIKADFVLKVHGDSMIGARIHDGDYVFIRIQPEVENGEIAAVRIGDSATLKRVYFYKEKSLMILKAENPAFEDMVYQDSELEDVQILGKAVAFQGDVR